jgi:transcription-repair coupling factor (superfamily II helicase)
MNLSSLLSLVTEVPGYSRLLQQLSRTEGESRLTILDAAKPYIIAALHNEFALPVMVITAQPEDRQRLYEELQVWCPPSALLHHFPEPDVLPYEYLASDLTTMLERLQVLSALAFWQNSQVNGAGPPLIVASAAAAMGKTIPRDAFVSACHTLKQGMTADPLELIGRWQTMGYEMENMIEVPGTMSRRGGIADIFPPCSAFPARIEFFGNQIESIRLFDPETQRSLKDVESITIVPAKEILLPRADSDSWQQIEGKLNSRSCAADVKERIEADMARLWQNQWFAGAEFYSPLFNSGSIFDYLPKDALLIVDSPEQIEAVMERLHEQAQELRQAKLQAGELPQGFPPAYFTWGELQPKIRARRRLVLEPWGENDGQALPFTAPQSYGGKLGIFLTAIKGMIKTGQRVMVLSHQANRLAELLEEEGIYTYPTTQVEQAPPPGSVSLVQGSLPHGWTMAHMLSLITDGEIFGFVKQRRPLRKKPTHRQWLLPQLSHGDYVVHVEHGIGRFKGLTKMTTDGIEREYLILEYAADDRLYVPTDQVVRLSPYFGAGDQPPPLSRLWTQEWARTKQRVKESAANSAQELLNLYASRELTRGFAFSPDTLWQQELEASFPYMETPDQLEAIALVKEEMEKAKPMERLICGDVGYGKTEVALRAAFKVVMDNKQVAVLVPTTVLAQQHFITFSERLQVFPLRVEVLSRFCSPKRERLILDGLAAGTVDICIGTHRLLQKDVVFKDLGLVVVDEEQRFGVAQKEQLKQLRREVDVLTLSATPIPRTLHMSLAGIRDMSIMETPPEQRLSIKTYVGSYDEVLVQRAILHELERNGQVFFVHNRVQSIAIVASRLKASVPEARMGIAHGQMPEEELERVMADFVAGNYDVLVTTTIIQSGLDMPNVNTLIVNQADRLGLTQLYQLRGRVGRGVNRAHAYFLFDKGKQLTPQAQKRLRTIFEATELGAGLGIAMKDLEIRGAGNLLGVKQSGHIAAVGFELYCQLLAEAVEELKAEREGKPARAEPEITPSIGLPLTAYIPEEYVPSLKARLILYHRLAKTERINEIEDMAQELRDRFGTLPKAVGNLLYLVKIKVLATKAEIDSIYTEERKIIIKPRRPEKLSLPTRYHGVVKVGPTQVRLDTKPLGDKWIEVLEEILTKEGELLGVPLLG